VTVKVPVPEEVLAVIVVVPWLPAISAIPFAVSVKRITLVLLELHVAEMLVPFTEAV